MNEEKKSKPTIAIISGGNRTRTTIRDYLKKMYEIDLKVEVPDEPIKRELPKMLIKDVGKIQTKRK